ncbi:MAG: hypothetical protein ACHQFW_11640 [Chitinophagales bacterium]
MNMGQVNNFSPQSKVWIYQSSRPFTENEIGILNNKLQLFAQQWTAHNQQLNAIGKVIEDRLILLMVDETHSNASGCSIDSSVHFIKSLEKEFNVDLFDRTLVNYIADNNLQTTKLNELNDLVNNGIIKNNTLVFDPLIKTKSEFDTRFRIPLDNSWMKEFIGWEI